MISRSYLVQEWTDEDGVSAYRTWIDSLDKSFKARIIQRIRRFEQGNLGDSKALGAGLFECRWMLGPGLRAYFGIEDGKIILLLGGGDKSTQSADIKKARQRWLQHRKN